MMLQATLIYLDVWIDAMPLMNWRLSFLVGWFCFPQRCSAYRFVPSMQWDKAATYCNRNRKAGSFHHGFKPPNNRPPQQCPSSPWLVDKQAAGEGSAVHPKDVMWGRTYRFLKTNKKRQIQMELQIESFAEMLSSFKICCKALHMIRRMNELPRPGCFSSSFKKPPVQNRVDLGITSCFTSLLHPGSVSTETTIFKRCLWQRGGCRQFEKLSCHALIFDVGKLWFFLRRDSRGTGAKVLVTSPSAGCWLHMITVLACSQNIKAKPLLLYNLYCSRPPSSSILPFKWDYVWAAIFHPLSPGKHQTNWKGGNTFNHAVWYCMRAAAVLKDDMPETQKSRKEIAVCRRNVI